jgi:hypothetical protein
MGFVPTVSLEQRCTGSIVIHEAYCPLPSLDSCTSSSGLQEWVKSVDVRNNRVHKCTHRVPEKVRTESEGNVNPQPSIEGNMRDEISK